MHPEAKEASQELWESIQLPQVSQETSEGTQIDPIELLRDPAAK